MNKNIPLDSSCNYNWRYIKGILWIQKKLSSNQRHENSCRLPQKKRLISFKKSKKRNYSNALKTELNGAMNTKDLKGKMYCNTHFCWSTYMIYSVKVLFEPFHLNYSSSSGLIIWMAWDHYQTFVLVDRTVTCPTGTAITLWRSNNLTFIDCVNVRALQT